MHIRVLAWTLIASIGTLGTLTASDTLPLTQPDTLIVPSEEAVSPNVLFESANELYMQGEFETAAHTYQLLVDSGYHSAELFYNLGNAYFKINRIPSAILNYERAYMLNPSDEDILFNLELAQSFTIDRIEELPEFLLTTWYRSFRGMLSSDSWAILSLVLLAATLLLILTFWFSRSSTLKRLSFTAAILTILLMVLTMMFSAQERSKLESRNRAIVFAPVVAVKSSPGDTGKDIFILHAGTKVEITNKLGDWVEIRIADGNKGWAPASAVEVVQVW